MMRFNRCSAAPSRTDPLPAFVPRMLLGASEVEVEVERDRSKRREGRGDVDGDLNWLRQDRMLLDVVEKEVLQAEVDGTQAESRQLLELLAVMLAEAPMLLQFAALSVRHRDTI